MGSQPAELSGPDFAQGFRLADLKDGSMLLGHAFGEAVLLVRRGDAAHAVGAFCTHYGAPLIEGVVSGDGIHCPWHHACFNLSSGAPLSPPALNGLTVWNLRQEGGRVYVTGKAEAAPPAVQITDPRAFVIVGGGAAGLVAAETLRHEGFRGRVLLISDDADAPYDRPNLSKDYLAGNAPEEWIPLRSEADYRDRAIEVRPSQRVTAIDAQASEIRLGSGEKIRFDALLLATGASPLRLPLPGADLPHIHALRSLADSRALIQAATRAKRAVIIGSSFIGLEVAASLRARGLDVTVVGKEELPLARALGPEMGQLVLDLHREKGVRFQLGRTPARIAPDSVELEGGLRLPADLVVMAVGVKPNVELAQDAGAQVDHGIVVDSRLRTSLPRVFAAGDVARYPDPITGQPVRIEHWVHAQRMARAAALNMLGRDQPFTGVPFFWSNHYDLSIAFTGHAGPGAERQVVGSLTQRDAMVIFREGGRVRAVATIGRDRAGLRAEAAFAAGDSEAVDQWLREVNPA
jgi:NADPH-dependent 2,4-dienoyl-CoA reductase/sulfur reductase-like enzyme/nitrite reductase/ring-hydroxylating ferredoxin subunit